jgi:hypothetical protein
VSGIIPEKSRFICTQLGVILIALAGLLEIVDHVFDWSSGWRRYMITVTKIETISRAFELDWANCRIAKTGSINENDKESLFKVVRNFVKSISELQIDETDKWVIEFNNSNAILNKLIKSGYELTEKDDKFTEKDYNVRKNK